MPSHLTPLIDLTSTRDRLESERMRLLEEAAQLSGRQQHLAEIRVHSGSGEDGAGADAGDAAAEIFEIELAGWLNENVRAHLDDVNAALVRMDDGRYGQCEKCSSPINYERLRALPWARRCLDCQRQAEVRRGRGTLVRAA
jgi:DnaK suppressor protein